jgi:hypothetical protein
MAEGLTPAGAAPGLSGANFENALYQDDFNRAENDRQNEG